MRTVLVADDDRVWSELLGSTLRGRGYDVITAFDGMQTTMNAMKCLPDLVVLDVQMPGGTGVDALRRLKMSSKTARIPVVVVSGAADPAVARTMAQLGVVRFLAKPAHPGEVADIVAAALGA